ncbi:PAS domain-containing protein [Nisaea acidiphila]|uniref:PAS domain-containing protein n=1 Tax=Nisaea acidiphila TaxID=1862145 RepID=A0A9J7ASH7_9PROT|nr:PAS domain-containing protein [Nisaea acidiphila]UUX50296.1 PAS domain-containing protein [Nisaea acidiphila]
MNSPDISIRDSLSSAGRDFLDYWLSLRAGRMMPDRAEFDPSNIKHLLPNIVIHELIAPDNIRLRLVGTAIVRHYGSESTGKNYLDFVEPDRRAKASKAIFLVRNHPAGMTVTLISSLDSGNLDFRQTVALPIGDERENRKFVYFCSTRQERSERSLTEPERLAVQNVMDRRFFDIGAGIPDFTD